MTQETSSESTRRTPIVALGASAGGLSALETLFEQVPDDTGAAFVVLQHLSPDYQSHMTDLLGRRTKMKTEQVSGSTIPEPNTVYLMPPSKHLIFEDEKLELCDREGDGELNLPINKFFLSLASAEGRPIAAMVFSGTGSDGSEGIVKIRESGGLVLSQDEDTAQFNSMPQNAFRTHAVHLVAPVPELAESLADYLRGVSIEEVVSSNSPTIERNELEEVYQRLDACCGVDFGQYKHGTFSRRLARRMSLAKIDDLATYTELLDNDQAEAARLADDLMIGVTRFFRDPDGYQRLANRSIRPAINGKHERVEFRTWVAGCATGQEAYSIAMLIHHEREQTGRDIPIRIFATDVHPDAIRFAQRGVYPADSLSEIPKHLRDKYTKKHIEGFEINREIRNSIVFARHDVLQDAPFNNMDLITCRNLLIYLIETSQARVLRMFAHALRPRGVLWLGPSETPGELIEDFTSLDKHWRIFQKERESKLPIDLRLRKRPQNEATIAMRTRKSRAPSAALIATYDRLLEQYAPPGILVDEEMRPLQLFGNLTRFIQAKAGRLVGTVDDLLIDQLRMPVMVAIQKMQVEQLPVTSQQAMLSDGPIEIRVTTFHHAAHSETHYLLNFLSQRFSPESANKLTDAENEVDISTQLIETEEATAERMNLLELELDFTRENLQATIEEVETTNEELQSSNEELTSSNEELQSTNEELHSVNEELHTTNAESERRLLLLTETTRDLESVMRESEVGVLLVDNELNIRRATPAAADVLMIRRRNAEGERLSDYADMLTGVNLVEVVQEVAQKYVTVEHEVQDRRNEPLLLRVAPYRDRSGVILTMTNLKSVKDTADKLRRLTSIVQDSSDAIIGVSLDGKITSWNRGAIRLFGIELDLTDLHKLVDVLPKSLSSQCISLVRELVSKGEVAAKELSEKLDGKRARLQVRVTPVFDESEGISAAAITISDVTAIRRAQEQLRLRNRAIDAASNGILIVDAQSEDMPIVYANKGFEDLTGFAREDITGRNCRFLQGPKTSQSDIDKIRTAIKNKESCRVTLLNYRRDGSQFYNDLIITPVFDADENLTHYVGVQSDVTAQFQANEALQRSELDYRSTFENAAVGIAHVGLEGEWLKANEKLLDILGYEWDELKELSFQSITHPEDLDKDLLHFAKMKRGEISVYSIQKRYIHKDGHVIWANLTTSLRRDMEGRAECCISLVEDITDRKKTEDNLASSRAIISEVVEKSRDPFVSFDSEGVIQVANRSAAKLAGSDEDFVGHKYSELFANQSPLVAAIERVRSSGEAETTEYYSQLLSRWYDVRVFPIGTGAAVSMTDVTNRKETESYLEAARLAAEEASQAKSKFLTNMSHEIRSPMSAILGFAELSLRDIRQGQQVDPSNIETVIRNGRFLLRIINDILDLSKVEAGKLEIRQSRFKLLPMLSDILELMRHRSESSGVPLSIDFQSEVPERLQSDRSRVEQILVNLIGNALKFTPKGSVRLVVELVGESNEFIDLKVVDTGIGISPANLDRLFQTFTQVHDRKLVGVEGTGLGLVISKRLAKLLGGDILASSVEGMGSQFTLRLPVSPSAELITATADDLKPSIKEVSDFEQLDARILVADDARDVRHVTRLFLNRAGAEVVEATNGAEAVNAVRQAEQEGHPFSCILMDMQMPEMDGLEATRQIRQEGFTMPIIALTAGATSEEISNAMSAGCSEFVSKPVDANDLIARVAKTAR